MSKTTHRAESPNVVKNTPKNLFLTRVKDRLAQVFSRNQLVEAKYDKFRKKIYLISTNDAPNPKLDHNKGSNKLSSEQRKRLLSGQKSRPLTAKRPVKRVKKPQFDLKIRESRLRVNIDAPNVAPVDTNGTFSHRTSKSNQSKHY